LKRVYALLPLAIAEPTDQNGNGSLILVVYFREGFNCMACLRRWQQSLSATSKCHDSITDDLTHSKLGAGQTETFAGDWLQTMALCEKQAVS
jgi:hypothetical protein